MIYPLLSTLWFLRQTKATLFWLYLWQLKEYHLGRFIDHFRTEKGKRIFLNRFFLFKVFLVLIFFTGKFVSGIIYILLVVYLVESGKALKDFRQRKFKKPVFTPKTAFLILFALTFQILFLLFNFSQKPSFPEMILLFDILTPAIISGILLFFQPLTVLWRWQVIKKAKLKREKFQNLVVIGITGSYGKTSTKEFLATILEEKFSSAARQKASYGGSTVASGEGGKVLKTLEHQNSEVGISQCILNNLKANHEIFIVEMGAYNRGGIKFLSDIAKPKIGILTGINEQHMATFGSQENIIEAKYELIQSLPREGLVIFNGDNPYCFKLYRRTIYPKKVYSLESSIYEFPVDIWASNIKVKKESIEFKAETKDEKANFKVKLLGAHNILNILAASLLAKELGMTLKEIARACQKIQPEQGAMKLLKSKMGANIIDSTYSANPDGVISHLDYLKIWKGQKIIVMPCLIELGRASAQVHKRIGNKIGQVCDLAIITTRERFKNIKEGAIEQGMNKENILFIENPKKILEKIQNFYSPNDVILLESRVPKKLVDELISK